MHTRTDFAYLILGHADPAHLAKLIHSLDTERSRFFIHIDKKSDIGQFLTLERDNVHFCDNRINCAWGDFSLVEATLELVRHALSHSYGAQRLVLLSGSCLPVQPTSYIEAFFDAHPADEFIEWFDFPNVRYGKPMGRIEHYWLRRNFSSLALKLKFGRLQGLFQQFINRRLPSRDYRSALEGLSLHAGSQWWALTRAAAEHLISFPSKNPSFYNFVKNTDCPDEFFFQTALANSVFRTHLRHSLTYASWQGQATGPEAISSQHLEALSRMHVRSAENSNSPTPPSEVLFARKFGSGSSAVGDAVLEANKRKANSSRRPIDLTPMSTT